MTKKILESKQLEQEARERLQTSPLRLRDNVASQRVPEQTQSKYSKEN